MSCYSTTSSSSTLSESQTGISDLLSPDTLLGFSDENDTLHGDDFLGWFDADGLERVSDNSTEEIALKREVSSLPAVTERHQNETSQSLVSAATVSLRDGEVIAKTVKHETSLVYAPEPSRASRFTSEQTTVLSSGSDLVAMLHHEKNQLANAVESETALVLLQCRPKKMLVPLGPEEKQSLIMQDYPTGVITSKSIREVYVTIMGTARNPRTVPNKVEVFAPEAPAELAETSLRLIPIGKPGPNQALASQHFYVPDGTCVTTLQIKCTMAQEAVDHTGLKEVFKVVLLFDDGTYRELHLTKITKAGYEKPTKKNAKAAKKTTKAAKKTTKATKKNNVDPLPYLCEVDGAHMSFQNLAHICNFPMKGKNSKSAEDARPTRKRKTASASTAVQRITEPGNFRDHWWSLSTDNKDCLLENLVGDLVNQASSTGSAASSSSSSSSSSSTRKRKRECLEEEGEAAQDEEEEEEEAIDSGIESMDTSSDAESVSSHDRGVRCIDRLAQQAFDTTPSSPEEVGEMTQSLREVVRPGTPELDLEEAGFLLQFSL